LSSKRLSNTNNTFKPSETVNPQALVAINLDDISASLTELIKIETDNQKLLAASFELQAAILQEIREEMDEGEVLSVSGTVTSTDFVFIDTISAPEHPVRGYSIKNDGSNTIYVGHNVTKAGLQPSISDVTSNLSRFRQINNKEEIRFIFKRRKIENVAILAQTGSSSYRGWLVW
jgi:predicted O-methyltransferase YrrM